MTHPLPKKDLEHFLSCTRPLWEHLCDGRIFVIRATSFVGIWLFESFVFANKSLDLVAKLVGLSSNSNASYTKVSHLTKKVQSLYIAVMCLISIFSKVLSSTLFTRAQLPRLLFHHLKCWMRLFAGSSAPLSLLVVVGYPIYKLLFWQKFATGTAPLLIGLFFFSSVQFFFIGILGE